MLITTRYAPAMIAAVALTVMSSAVIAQAAEETSEVKVVASTPVLKAGRNNKGQSVEIAQLTRKVSYADLNIATHSGATELEKRIGDAAKAVCKDLAELYPAGTSEGLGSGSCVKDATKDAMAQAKVAIAAAESAAVNR